MKETKFKIEGKIEGHENADSIDKSSKKKRKNYKPALLFFIILTVILAATSAYFYLSSISRSDSSTSKADFYQSRYHDSIQIQNAQIDSLNVLIKENAEALSRLQETTDENDGVFFEVQIGNFKDFNLDAYLEEMAAIRQEKHDGRNKLLLGKFRSFKKALLFENDLRRMGMSDVFIKGRIDGKLVSKEEALDYLRNQ